MSLGGSAPAGASTNQPRAGASVYTPGAQPQADVQFQSITGGLLGALGPDFQNVYPGLPSNTTANAFSTTPAAIAYQGAQPWIGAGSITDPNNPYYQQAIQAAQAAATGGQNILGAAATLPNSAAFARDLGFQSMDPAIYGGQEAINYGVGSALPQAIATAQGLQPDIASLGSGLSSLFGTTLPQTQSASDALFGAGSSILNTGFDPQQALYDRTQNQVAQQAAAQAAQAGLGGTAYGASVDANALGNFNINWQNAQLARQAQAEQAAAQAFTAGAGLPGGVMQQGGQIGQQIAALSAAAGALPSTLAGQYGNLASQTSGLGFAPLQSYGNLISALPSLYQSGATLGGLPYGATSTGTSNALQALGSGANLGMSQYVLPQQVMQDLQSYLGLGQAASQLSGYLGNLGLQQQQNAFSGLGSALGTAGNILGNPFTSSSSSGLLGGVLGNPFSSTSGGLLGGAFAGGNAGAGLGAAGQYFTPLTGSLGADATFGGGADLAGSALAGGAGLGAADLGATAAAGGGFFDTLGGLAPFLALA